MDEAQIAQHALEVRALVFAFAVLMLLYADHLLTKYYYQSLNRRDPDERQIAIGMTIVAILMGARAIF